MTSIVAQYFLNHRLDLEEIGWQMAELAKAGFQGVEAHARQGLLTPYMSEHWWRAVDKIMDLCRQRGMEFWIWDEDYFPSGLAGGRVVWDDPGLIARGLEFSVTEVQGQGPFEVDFPPGMLLRAHAVRKHSDNTYAEIEDVTAFCGTRRQEWTPRRLQHTAYSPMVNNVGHPHWRCTFRDNRFALSWKPPQPGTYVIVAAVIVQNDRPMPDHLRPEAIGRFIEMSYEPYYRRYGKEFGKLIKAAFTDEPRGAFSLYPWTGRFAEEFRADHGYDLLDHLPHLGLDIAPLSRLVRHHFRLTQHRLIRVAYVEQIAKWCQEHRIASTGHLPRTEWLSLTAAWWPNELRCYQPMHIPAVDPLGGSCGWCDSASYHSGIKVVTSAAHLFGRAQASSDALAVVGDEAALRDLKYILDYQMVLGINHFNIHGLSYSLDGPRKDEVPPSLFYQHTEWKHMATLLDHVRRTCEALTGGVHLCELAVLYPSTSLACQMTPNTDWPRIDDEETIHRLVEQLLSEHRDFDWIDEVTLTENVDSAGAITTAEPYRAVLLPHLRYIDTDTADALLRFAGAGSSVIVVGSMPQAITKDLKAPLREWADSSIDFVERLDDDTIGRLPGADVHGENSQDVFVLRRKSQDHTITFLFNRNEEAFEGKVMGQAVSVAARGSVLLRDSGAEAEVPARLDATAATELTGPWQVQFQDNHVPLNFWHAVAEDEVSPGRSPFALPSFNLMAREEDPTGCDDKPASYYCRFMLTGEIPDARLVMEDSTIDGDWKLYVNDIPIGPWTRSVVFDCRNIEASIAGALRGGSVGALNILRIEASGNGRGLKEVPYIYGSFTARYRYGHPSLPFLKGPAGSAVLDSLLPWDAVGYPTFSGSATYRRKIEIADSGDYVLDLGRVEDIASITLDDGPAIVLAWPPYRCLLTGVKSGVHELAIEVTNAPANRNRAAHLPAGLLGPVKLLRPVRCDR